MVRFPKFDRFDPRIPRIPRPCRLKGLGRLDRFDPAREVTVEAPAEEASAKEGPKAATSAVSAVCICRCLPV